MTHKVLGILKRPDGMTFEQFKKWWVEVHAPRVMKLDLPWESGELF